MINQIQVPLLRLKDSESAFKRGVCGSSKSKFCVAAQKRSLLEQMRMLLTNPCRLPEPLGTDMFNLPKPRNKFNCHISIHKFNFYLNLPLYLLKQDNVVQSAKEQSNGNN